MRKIFKAASLLLASILLISGCAATTATDNNEKEKVFIGNWPPENKPMELQDKNKKLEEMSKRYPDIEYIPDTWMATPESFLVKASANQLPTIFPVFFTEVKKIISAGYAADITEYIKKYDIIDYIDEIARNLVSENGRIYGVPSTEYCMGLYVNNEVFREAGLLKEDGTVNFPNSYAELVETAKIIKERTGKPGFVMPGASNWGGWHFMNIAWSFGVEFMRKNEDERWIACFDSDETVAALQYVKDLKWKYKVLPEENYIDSYELMRMYANDEVGMFIGSGLMKDLVTLYNIDTKRISIGKIPEGPKGRYSLLGGSVDIISSASTPEQIEAALIWRFAGVDGHGEEKNTTGDKYWQIKKGIRAYLNLEWKNMREYYMGVEEVTLRVEEPINAQGLYQTLDGCIREVLQNPDADCRQVIENACKEFQKNYLDDFESK